MPYTVKFWSPTILQSSMLSTTRMSVLLTDTTPSVVVLGHIQDVSDIKLKRLLPRFVSLVQPTFRLC